MWQHYDRKQIQEVPIEPNRPETCRECGGTCGRLERDICLRELDS